MKTKQTTHTPGPWIAKEWGENDGYDCITPAVRIEADKPDGRTIVVVDAANYGWNRTGLGNAAPANHEESRARVLADARLIAAAPELLEALRVALEIIEGEYPADDEIAAPVVSKIRAAIAKAKGEA